MNMRSEWIFTLADESQIRSGQLESQLIHGRSEPRIAWVGRSNVGKSSLINALLEAKVAQVSAQPGKTRAIYFYTWPNAGKILADLPGYGFAKAAREERDRWEGFINQYLRSDINLERIVMLWDARHGPTELDEQAFRFMASHPVGLQVVMTKMDQVKTQSDRARRKKEVAAKISAWGGNPADVLWVSIEKGGENAASIRQLRQSLLDSKTNAKTPKGGS